MHFSLSKTCPKRNPKLSKMGSKLSKMVSKLSKTGSKLSKTGLFSPYFFVTKKGGNGKCGDFVNFLRKLKTRFCPNPPFF